MNILLSKEEILQKSLEALKESFNIKASFRKEIGQYTPYEIQMRFLLNGRETVKNYHLEIDKPRSTFIGQLAIKQKQLSNKIILVTDFVPPTIADKLRELDIFFFDANGNAFFNEPEFYIFISSRGRTLNLSSPKPSLIFQASGLKLLFVLLSVPNAENKTYRELAEMSGVSLGSVSEVMNALTAELYLVKQNEKRILFRKDFLMKRWVQGFAEILRPKLSEMQFEAEDSEWWRETDLAKIGACWSGEVAADMMTGYLTPTTTLIYAKGLSSSLLPLVKEHKLRRVREGNVKTRRKFWNFNESDNIAPPLLIYADLLATAESRNLEAAQIIYDEHLAGLVE
jgi:hypothetical protein